MEDAVDWLTDLAVTIQLAEMCGAMHWAFDTTVEWAFNRYSFGRPLASYQEIKHRFADMKMCLEASFAITAQAAEAVDRETPDRTELVSAGKFYVGAQWTGIAPGLCAVARRHWTHLRPRPAPLLAPGDHRRGPFWISEPARHPPDRHTRRPRSDRVTHDHAIESVESFTARAGTWLAGNMPRIEDRGPPPASRAFRRRGAGTHFSRPGTCSARCSTVASQESAYQLTTEARA